MRRYLILKNIEGYDGFYVCYRVTIIPVRKSNGPIYEQQLEESVIVAVDDDLNSIRESIPSNYLQFKGEESYDERLVEVWLSIPGLKKKKNDIL